MCSREDARANTSAGMWVRQEALSPLTGWGPKAVPAPRCCSVQGGRRAGGRRPRAPTQWGAAVRVGGKRGGGDAGSEKPVDGETSGGLSLNGVFATGSQR